MNGLDGRVESQNINSLVPLLPDLPLVPPTVVVDLVLYPTRFGKVKLKKYRVEISLPSLRPRFLFNESGDGSIKLQSVL